MLLLSGNGAARRACRVVWRQRKQIGVTFELPLPATERATLVRRPRTHSPFGTAAVDPAETA
jgi:hypothetical protein